MNKPVALMIVPFFCILFSAIEVSAELRERRNSPQPSEITVTLKMDWNVALVQDKTIPASYITKIQNGTALVDIVNKAAGDNKKGPFNKYDSIYYGGMGYFIIAMNGIKQDPDTGTYWMILDEPTGGLIPCGVDFYVPRNGSSIIFRFTTYSASSSHNNSVSGYCKPKLAPSPGEVPPSPITVTIALDWDVKSVGKTIPASYTTQVTSGTVLVDIMNKAADENTKGPFNKYASTYYGGLGHFITAMNGIKQDPQTDTYWMIYDNKTGSLTSLGVDQYKPEDGSVTVFRLVKGASHGPSAGPTRERPTETLAEIENSAHKFAVVGLVSLCLLAAIEGLLFF